MFWYLIMSLRPNESKKMNGQKKKLNKENEKDFSWIFFLSWKNMKKVPFSLQNEH